MSQPRSLLLSSLSCCLLLSACAAAPERAAPVDASATSSSPRPAPVRSVAYACADGERVELRSFPEQGVGVLVRQGSTVELRQQPVGSGVLYRSDTVAVRGQGEEILLEIDGRPAVRCTEL